MPDWITNIGISAAGLPWWAVLLLMLLAGAAREAIPAALKWRGFDFDREKYKDGEAREAREALVHELEKQVKDLYGEVVELSKKHESATAAHAKCEIEQERIRGDLRVMQVQIDALMRHDKANADNTKKLAAIVQEETGKAPTIV